MAQAAVCFSLLLGIQLRMSGVRLLQHQRQSNTHFVVDFSETRRKFSVLVLNRNAEGLSHGKIQFIFHVIAHLGRDAVESDGFAGRADEMSVRKYFADRRYSSGVIGSYSNL